MDAFCKQITQITKRELFVFNEGKRFSSSIGQLQLKFHQQQRNSAVTPTKQDPSAQQFILIYYRHEAPVPPVPRCCSSGVSGNWKGASLSLRAPWLLSLALEIRCRVSVLLSCPHRKQNYQTADRVLAPRSVSSPVNALGHSGFVWKCSRRLWDYSSSAPSEMLIITVWKTFRIWHK